MKYGLLIVSGVINVVMGFLFLMFMIRGSHRYVSGIDDVRYIFVAEPYSVYNAAGSVVFSKGDELFLQVDNERVLLNRGDNMILLLQDSQGEKYIHRKAGKTLKVFDTTLGGN